MKIGIASDHRGYELKQELFLKLKKEYEITDLGCTSEESVDYPDYAFQLGEQLKNGILDFGIAICGSGIGISIACNKVKGVRAARVVSRKDAFETREDNDANVICLNEKLTSEEAYSLVTAFLTTPFSNKERHIRRVQKIRKYEEDHYEC